MKLKNAKVGTVVVSKSTGEEFEITAVINQEKQKTRFRFTGLNGQTQDVSEEDLKSFRKEKKAPLVSKAFPGSPMRQVLEFLAQRRFEKGPDWLSNVLQKNPEGVHIIVSDSAMYYFKKLIKSTSGVTVSSIGQGATPLLGSHKPVILHPSCYAGFKEVLDALRP